VDIDTAVFQDPLVIAGGTIHDAAGTDVTAPSVTFHGDVAPGQSPGILEVAGDVNFADNSSFTVEIGGTAPGSTNTDHDQLSATGAVVIGNNVTLVTAAWSAFVPLPGDTFVIVSRSGGSGTFAGSAEGAILVNFLGTGRDATISYTGGDGDDIVLTAQSLGPAAVPMLSNLQLIGLALALAFVGLASRKIRPV